MGGFKKGSDPVHQSDLSDVLKVLTGPSPWKEYIEPNLKVAKAAKHSFTVLPVNKFREQTGHGLSTPGVTFKRNGAIIMQEWGRPETSYLSAVLHECVHWVSDPAKQGAEHSTAWDAMGEGILEGLVECVTEDILKEQNIELPANENQRGHQKRVPVVRELLKTTSVPFFARALFRGELTQWCQLMEFVYSPIGLKHIRNFTGANATQMALNAIKEWKRKEEDRRKTTDIVHMLTKDGGTLLEWVLRMP
jgi:hypothetical protein